MGRAARTATIGPCSSSLPGQRRIGPNRLQKRARDAEKKTNKQMPKSHWLHARGNNLGLVCHFFLFRYYRTFIFIQTLSNHSITSISIYKQTV
jgi:hypothetical protein